MSNCFYSRPVPVLARGGEVVVLLAGKPRDLSYEENLRGLEKAVTDSGERFAFSARQRENRRGSYLAISTGVSIGSGSTVRGLKSASGFLELTGVCKKVPGGLKLGSRENEKIVEGLLEEKGMRRIVGFVKRKYFIETNQTTVKLTHSSGSTEVFAPELCKFVTDTLEEVKRSKPSLRYPYRDNPFAAVTFNIGPKVCTVPHKDVMNLSWGWCAVTSLGCYDPKKGGHLVLWDLKLAVEFPPFSTIMLPSAIMKHSNTSIGPTERRSSVTQYNASGLFCWVAHGNSLKAGRKKSGQAWWDRPKHMFSRISGGSGKGIHISSFSFY